MRIFGIIGHIAGIPSNRGLSRRDDVSAADERRASRIPSQDSTAITVNSLRFYACSTILRDTRVHVG